MAGEGGGGECLEGWRRGAACMCVCVGVGVGGMWRGRGRGWKTNVKIIGKKDSRVIRIHLNRFDFVFLSLLDAVLLLLLLFCLYLLLIITRRLD